MSVLSRKFGLSDVGLAKICRKLRVPTPGRGYWARKSAGQKMKATPLPSLSRSIGVGMQSVTIRGWVDAPTDDKTEPVGPVADQQRFERAAENRIIVSERLENPHSLVAQSVAMLRRAKPGDRGYLMPKGECLDVQVTLDSSDRAMCILDALIKALDSRGYPTSIRKNGDTVSTSVRIAEQDVAIKLTEHVDRIERKDEKRKASMWSLPQYDWLPTGRLTLRIDQGWGDGTRQSWSDGKQQRLENCLNQLVVGLVVVAEQLRSKRLEWAEQERQRRTAEEHRILEKRRQEDEAARIRAIENAIAQWRTSRDVRVFVLEVRQSLTQQGEVSEAMTQWLEWADDFADRIDPLLPAPSVPIDPEPPERSRYLL